MARVKHPPAKLPPSWRPTSIPPCGTQHIQICHCQTCNFSSSQNKLHSLPQYCINNLQITVEQKIGAHSPTSV